MRIQNYLYIILLLPSYFGFGQQLHSSISRDKILIGEPFVYTLSVEAQNTALHSLKYQMHEKELMAKLSLSLQEKGEDFPFEIIAVTQDTFVANSGQKSWSIQYELTAWDSAFVVLPPEKISINDSLFTFPAQMIEVDFPSINPDQGIYDINEVFTDIMQDKILRFIRKNWWWLFPLFFGLIYCAYRYIHRSEKTIEELSLKEKTLAAIDELAKQKGYEENLKEYYYDLSQLLRRFLGEYYAYSILDKTTSQIERFLLDQALTQSFVDEVSSLLTQSDMVKFAQSKPHVSEILKVTDAARSVVKEISEKPQADEA